ncbi:gluconokinase [Subtercola frigoramans]|uniref:Gluconokinase n=1 Tax=Subtercola frigoramans TaxID=120298 RepID=A0ABS2L1E1_9MICO|nr:gluconokinase [Subtercola frigoramans]MBM7470894.1 carbohydrate kinase (thermoresistant glucokinase family) [Subtercola frigoramans]
MADLVIVAGVSGSGKSTVGEALALELGVPFVDADSLHSAANVAKMAGGTPLTDEDRGPWLDSIGQAMRSAENDGLVMACSSLRRRYRDQIRASAPGTFFVTLTGSRELLAERLAGRAGHFMPPALLDSQLAAFEPLQPDERGIDLSIDAAPDTLVARAVEAIRAHP